MTSSSPIRQYFLYILIGIALFAALGYAVSRSYVKTDTVSSDKAGLYATEIVNYGNQVSDAMAKLRLRGCKDNQYDFSNPIYKTHGGGTPNGMSPNSNTPSDGSCKLFDANGGGLLPVIMPAEALTTAPYPGSAEAGHGEMGISQIRNFGTFGPAGTISSNDVFIQFLWLNLPTCLAVNSLLGIANPSGHPPDLALSGSIGGYSNGDLSASAILYIDPNGANKAFCYRLAGNYAFLRSILPR